MMIRRKIAFVAIRQWQPRIRSLEICTRAANNASTQSQPSDNNQVTVLSKTGSPVVNVSGEYGTDFNDQECFACNMMFGDRRLMIHLYDPLHVRKMLDNNRISVDSNTKQQLYSNFDVIRSQLLDLQQSNMIENLNNYSTVMKHFQVEIDISQAMGPQVVPEVQMIAENVNLDQGYSKAKQISNDENMTLADNINGDLNLLILATNQENGIMDAMMSGDSDKLKITRDGNAIITTVDGKNDVNHNVEGDNNNVYGKYENKHREWQSITKESIQLCDRINKQCNSADDIYKLLNEKDEFCDINVHIRAMQKCLKKGLWKDCVNIVQMTFEKNKKRNLLFYTILFKGAANDSNSNSNSSGNGNGTGVNDVFPKYFDLMVNKDKIKPQDFILNQLLRGCIKTADLTLAKDIWTMFDKHDIIKDQMSFGAMITICSKAKNINEAETIFRQCENPNKNVIFKFLKCLANDKKKGLKRYGKYTKKALQNENIVWNIQDYNLFMVLHLKLGQPLKAVQIFDHYIDNKHSHTNNENNENHEINSNNDDSKNSKNSKNKNNNKEETIIDSLVILQTAYFQLQKHVFTNRIKVSDKEKEELFDYYHNQVVEIIPYKISAINSTNSINALHSDTNMESINSIVCRVIIRAKLQYYGQCGWYEALDDIEEIMKDYNFSFWIYDKLDNEWKIDLHKLSPEMVVFGLRYVFIKDEKFLSEMEYDLHIITGSGFKKRQRLNDVVSNKSNKSNNSNKISIWDRKNLNVNMGDIIWNIQDVIIFETRSWQSVKKIRFKYTPNPEYGYLVIRRKHLAKFYNTFKERRKLLEQKTKTCKTFIKDWTEPKRKCVTQIHVESDNEDNELEILEYSSHDDDSDNDDK